MYIVTGYTRGKSSRSFEGMYKDVDDVRDVHETLTLKVRRDLQYFVVTNNEEDLVLWSFDIPGYETHIYSLIKETATLMLCPRIDNSTYLIPDISMLGSLSGVLSRYEYRDVIYFVRPLNREFVMEALREVHGSAMAVIMRMLMSAGRARGAALARLRDKVEYAEELINRALDMWRIKGYEIDASGIKDAIIRVKAVVSGRLGKTNR
ncbi:hypothetical protein [Vulcanisaeta distributa]|uniref:Uncharacterized protein n=1 Tax=Vulcanisaeta distributa (strain DSM 14429 / JCM 11212 / NBRC 100878 / IC-017) TaxID=572478 RepID=E1QS54_VULDI|nr:hypothetical protein [Vulcanisaeta distributa]ADN51886.1 conserved hypothetical protein [Vulcanisaeta distributa DSM 14429]